MQSIEERAAAAYELKATGKCNCSQSVVKVFQDKLPVGEDTLMKLTAGYAAGMGCMESTCGALVGAVMVAGILTDGIRPGFLKDSCRSLRLNAALLSART